MAEEDHLKNRTRDADKEKINAICGHYKALVDSSEDAIISKDLNGIVLTWNQGAENIFGYTAEEMIGRPLTHYFPPEKVEEELKILARVRAGERIEHYETIRWRKDGRFIDVAFTISPIKDSNGEIIGASKIGRDITAKKRSETMARRFEALIASSDDAIVSKDLNGIIQTWNQGAEKIFGYTAEEVVGKPVTILFPPENVHEEAGILAKLRAGQRIEHYETVRKRKDGQLINVSLTVSPIENSEGKIVGASKIARDVTEKKQWETEMKRAHEELERANEELEKANRAKDNFLAMLSHELRTPLNPVLLVASDAATDPALASDVRTSFEMILHNVEMETRLIDDLLDLARVRTGKLKLEKRKLDLHEILLNSFSLIKNQAEEKGISLVLDLEAAPASVLGDAVRLQQVFSNVLKNAVKFTPEKGTVTVRAGSVDSQYAVAITDTGIGMAPDELAVVFEPFRQGEHHPGVPQRSGGLGLGLAISSAFVKYHDGTIEASSEGRGRGSTFTIKLPLLKEPSTGKTEHFRAKDFERGMHLFHNQKIAA